MKLPKNCKDWHTDCIKASQIRYEIAVTNEKNEQRDWRKAWDALLASQNPIYVQPTGQGKGDVKGMPKGVPAKMVMRLSKIIYGMEDVEVYHQPKRRRKKDEPAQPAPDPNRFANATREDMDQLLFKEKFYTGRKPRDSIYVILASIYSQIVDETTWLYKNTVLNKAKTYGGGHIMDYDYRTRQHGAWQQKDTLVVRNIIEEERTYNR